MQNYFLTNSSFTHFNDSLEIFLLLYQIQIILALGAFFVNIILCFYSFSGDYFNPHTTVIRLILIMDVCMSSTYILDAIYALMHQEPFAHKLIQMFKFNEYLLISECALSRPYLLVILIGRQWVSFIVLVLGFERFLFIAYPFWFNSIHVRRGPIIVFTLMFSTMSAGIGYTNSLFMAPEELVYFICELTWSFGENYGWCQSFFIIIPQILGVLFNQYAGWITSSKSAVFLFGSNRNRLNSEKRKIRKTKLVVLTNAIFYCLPQIACIILRLISKWHFNGWKLLINQLFLLKFFGNFILYQLMCRRGRGLIYTAKVLMNKRSKSRVNSNDSVLSVSYYVRGTT